MPISMSTPDPVDLAEALHLTRSGRLAEATAAIQRALGGASRSHSPVPNCRANPGRVHGAPLRSLPPMPPMRPGAGLGVDLSSLPRLDRLPGLDGLPGLAGGTAPATSRPYRLHVPTQLPPGPRPLVVLLHGGTQDSAAFAQATGFDAFADAHGFLALYPEQITAANPMRYWNWFNRADQQRDAGEPSILVGLVEQVAAEHPIDRDRVYVAGFSAGAAMASVLGAVYPDVFAGIGVHSGLAHGAAGDMVSAFSAMGRAPLVPAVDHIPAIIIHGDADPTVHVSNAGSVLEQFAPVGATRRTVAEQVNGRHIQRTILETDGRTVSECIVISGAGHTWSGGRPGGSYADPSGPDATAEMIRFFGLASGDAGKI